VSEVESTNIKTRIVRNTQKNGDIYVFERQTIYDQDKKYNRVLSSKLLHKIPKDSETPVPTRPKKPDSAKGSNISKNVTASRDQIGMMEIIDHIGTVSGIDEGIYSNTDIGTAQKIISIARYFLASNGQTLPGILTWQFNHPLPYEDGISEGIYHDLFVQVGRDESLQQSFFANRCASIGGRAVLGYDSTNISTYSENQIEARYGFTKDEVGLKTIKLLTLYSIETRQPIAFTKQPGNLPDNVEKGINLEDLTKTIHDKVKKYLYIKRWGNKIHVSYNEAACKEAKKYFGYFALVSNCEKDPFECLRKYRKRATIESFFESMKQRADGTRVRVWDSNTLRGRLFVQFVALCYYEHLSNDIRNIKDALGVLNGDPGHDSAANIKLEKKLKAWLDSLPIYLVLQWFDTIEGVKVSYKLSAKRWTTEITTRDRMFLDKLGVALPY